MADKFYQGETKGGGRVSMSELWQEFYAGEGDEEIEQQVYWGKTFIEPSAPILARGRAAELPGHEIRSELQRFAKLSFKLPDLASLGFELTETDDGSAYKFLYRLKLTCDKANVDITFQIVMPESKLNETPDHVIMAGDVTAETDNVYEVVSATHSHVPRIDPD